MEHVFDTIRGLQEASAIPTESIIFIDLGGDSIFEDPLYFWRLLQDTKITCKIQT